jgi:hypothetical protein
MEILNFDSNGSGRSPKKRARLVTIIGGAFLFAAVGSTFAANITINTSNSLEYAQGITQATACNPSLLIQPANRFINSAGGGSFALETITVSDTTSATAAGVGLGNCNGKTLRIAAYGDTGAALNISGTGDTTFCDIRISTYGSVTSNTVAAANPSSSNCVASVVSGQNFFSVVFTSANRLAASSINKITIESFNTPA